MIKQVFADEFVERFMEVDLTTVKYQLSSIKLFKLNEIAPFIKTPTSTFFLGYNLFVFVTNGKFKQQVGNIDFSIKAPAILVCNYGTMTSIKEVDFTTEGYCLLIKEEAMTSIFREQEILNIFDIFPLLNLREDDSVFVSNAFSLLLDEIHSTSPYKELIESLVKVLLLKILKLSNNNIQLTRRQEIVMKYKRLVHENFKTEKQLSFYAEKLAVSLNYLNRCVTDVLNKSSKDLLQEITILHSQFLLLESSKSIADISYEINFDDPAYFTRLFKKIVGVSPTAYRDAMIKS